MKTKLLIAAMLMASLSLPSERASADSKLSPVGLGILTGVVVATVAANAHHHNDYRRPIVYREVRHVHPGRHRGWYSHQPKKNRWARGDQRGDDRNNRRH